MALRFLGSDLRTLSQGVNSSPSWCHLYLLSLSLLAFYPLDNWCSGGKSYHKVHGPENLKYSWFSKQISGNISHLDVTVIFGWSSFVNIYLLIIILTIGVQNIFFKKVLLKSFGFLLTKERIVFFSWKTFLAIMVLKNNETYNSIFKLTYQSFLWSQLFCVTTFRKCQ